MKQLRTSFALALAISMLAVACGPSATPTPSGSGAISNEPFVMLSTQFNTVTESEAVSEFTVSSPRDGGLSMRTKS